MTRNLSSPLHVAMIGEARAFTFLEAGADIDAINNRGWSPLFEAVIQDELGVENLAKCAHALGRLDIVMPCDGRCTLHAAVHFKNVEMAQLLLSFGAHVEPKNSRTRPTPARVASAARTKRRFSTNAL